MKTRTLIFALLVVVALAAFAPPPPAPDCVGADCITPAIRLGAPPVKPTPAQPSPKPTPGCTGAGCYAPAPCDNSSSTGCHPRPHCYLPPAPEFCSQPGVYCIVLPICPQPTAAKPAPGSASTR